MSLAHSDLSLTETNNSAEKKESKRGQSQSTALVTTTEQKEEKTSALSIALTDILSTITPEEFAAAKQRLSKWPVENTQEFRVILRNAASTGDLPMIALLCKHGLEPEGDADLEARPLFCAVKNWQTKAALLLLQLGAIPDRMDLSWVLYGSVVRDCHLRPVLIKEMRQRKKTLFESPWFELPYDGNLLLVNTEYFTNETNPKDADGFTIMHYACMGGDLKAVVRLSELYRAQGRSLSPESSHKGTPLHYAVTYEHLHIVRHLCSAEFKGDLSKTNYAYLHLCHTRQMARLLIANKVRIHRILQDGHNEFTIRWAFFPSEEFPAIFEYCANQLSDPGSYYDFVNHRARPNQRKTLFCSLLTEKETYTPEQRVIAPELRKVLLRCKADVNVPDDKGNTPLHLVAMQGDVAEVKFLIKQGANLNARNRAGHTPLFAVYKAIEEEKSKLANPPDRLNALLKVKERLIKAGADLNFVLDEKLGLTPLQVAVKDSKLDEARFLLERRNDIVNGRNALGKTALFYVSNVAMGKLLLDFNADVHARDNEEGTVLHEDLYDVVTELFLEHKADIQARNSEGLLPLQSDIRKRHQVSKHLLNNTQLDKHILHDAINRISVGFISNAFITIFTRFMPNLPALFASEDRVDIEIKNKLYRLEFELQRGGLDYILLIKSIIFEVEGCREKSDKCLESIFASKSRLMWTGEKVHNVVLKKAEFATKLTNNVIREKDQKEEKDNKSPPVLLPDYKSFYKYFNFAMIIIDNCHNLFYIDSIRKLLKWARLVSDFLASDVLTQEETQQLYFLKKTSEISIQQQIEKLEVEEAKLPPNAKLSKQEISRKLAVLKQLAGLDPEVLRERYENLLRRQNADLTAKLVIIKPLQYQIVRRLPHDVNLSAKEHMQCANLLLEYQHQPLGDFCLSKKRRYELALTHVQKALVDSEGDLRQEALGLQMIIERGLRLETVHVYGKPGMFKLETRKPVEVKETKQEPVRIWRRRVVATKQ